MREVLGREVRLLVGEAAAVGSLYCGGEGRRVFAGQEAAVVGSGWCSVGVNVAVERRWRVFGELNAAVDGRWWPV